MKIAIIGAGFTGLSAAYKLSKENHEVLVFEKDSNPGGLAVGYKEDNWDWSLEKHYHHLFTNDKSILNLAKEIHHQVIIKKPKTSVFVNNKIYLFDSPLSVLKFPLLSIIDRFRMGAIVGFLKYFPFWKILESHNASLLLPKLMGNKAYSMIWEPLFINKFGRFANDVSLAWFWARIVKRTPSLVYPEGGFLSLAKNLSEQIKTKGGKLLFETEIIEIKQENKLSIIFKDSTGKTQKKDFDKIIVTTPSYLFLKFVKNLPAEYKNQLNKLKSLGATNLILRMNKPFFKDDTYWLNVCEKNAPVMAIVEHTNFMNKKNYNNEFLLYLGNYRDKDDKYFSMTKEQMLNYFDSYLKKINPDYRKNIINFELFKTPFAQPIIPTNYSRLIPPFKTPLANVFLANIEQVYPWDRGVNYAVELGEKIADTVTKNA